MEGDTKKKVVPELLPRALWTWVTGLLLLLLVFYQGNLMFDEGMGGMGGCSFPVRKINKGEGVLTNSLLKRRHRHEVRKGQAGRFLFVRVLHPTFPPDPPSKTKSPAEAGLTLVPIDFSPNVYLSHEAVPESHVQNSCHPAFDRFLHVEK